MLLTGSLTSSVFDLLSLAVAARALGPELFGSLVLIQTYVTVVNSLINFQSWQAVIKYGADALVQKRTEDFKSLIKFGTFLDLATATLATIVAILGIHVYTAWSELSTQTVEMTSVYALIIVFNVVSTPTAVLRLFERFKGLAIQRAATAAVKLAGIGVAVLAGGGIWAVLLVWAAASIAGNLVLVGMGWYELRQQGYRGVMSASVRAISQKYPGMWRFVATTNLSSSIRLGARYVDVLVVGAVLGTATVGIYKVAKQFGRIPGMLGQPIQQTAYPDMAKLWAEHAVKRFRNYILFVGGLGGAAGVAIWLFFLLAGRWILETVVGAEYGPAYALLIVYMLGHVIYLFGVGFRPAILSMLHPERILYIYVVGHAVFFFVLLVLLSRIGVMAAPIAQVAFHATWFIGMALSIAGLLRQGASRQTTQPAA